MRPRIRPRRSTLTTSPSLKAVSESSKPTASTHRATIRRGPIASFEPSVIRSPVHRVATLDRLRRAGKRRTVSPVEVNLVAVATATQQSRSIDPHRTTRPSLRNACFFQLHHRFATGITNRNAVCVAENEATLLSFNPAALPAFNTPISVIVFNPFGYTIHNPPAGAR